MIYIDSLVLGVYVAFIGLYFLNVEQRNNGLVEILICL